MYPNFGKDEDGNLAVSGSGSGSDNLFDFLNATGVSGHVLPYSENPLPAIEKIAQEEGKTFKVVVNKGRIDTILVPMEDAFEEGEAEHPALKD
jgi:hypothetical protein